jgi:hypothetical protein
VSLRRIRKVRRLSTISPRNPSEPERSVERSGQRIGVGAVCCGAVCFVRSVVANARKSCDSIVLRAFLRSTRLRVCMIRARLPGLTVLFGSFRRSEQDQRPIGFFGDGKSPSKTFSRSRGS